MQIKNRDHNQVKKTGVDKIKKSTPDCYKVGLNMWVLKSMPTCEVKTRNKRYI